jgi:hypothetical protein
MPKFRVTFVVDTPSDFQAATGFKFAHNNIKCLSKKVSKVRGPYKKIRSRIFHRGVLI